MSKHRNICLPGKNSTLQTTLPANDKAVVKNLFSWHTASKVYLFLSFGLLDEVAEEDAKGYVKCLTSFMVILWLAGLMEGGAL